MRAIVRLCWLFVGGGAVGWVQCNPVPLKGTRVNSPPSSLSDMILCGMKGKKSGGSGVRARVKWIERRQDCKQRQQRALARHIRAEGRCHVPAILQLCAYPSTYSMNLPERGLVRPSAVRLTPPQMPFWLRFSSFRSSPSLAQIRRVWYSVLPAQPLIPTTSAQLTHPTTALGRSTRCPPETCSTLFCQGWISSVL